jgi:cation diffusion facilitator CzcD-associated flavoprotein CzcO
MLQRSPTYIVARPSEDAVANWLRRRLPSKLAHALARWKSVLLGMYFYGIARWKPALTKQTIVKMVREQLDANYDVDTHFTPTYNPWDQRLCLVPDADLFAAIKAGKASVVTDHIETFTTTGIRLRSGKELDTDIIVTATGLVLKILGGMQLIVDGKPVVLSETMSYKGMMFSDVPNLALALGYTNASWTLKCELTSEYICRLLNYMDRKGYKYSTPRLTDPSITAEPVLNFTSGYVQRAINTLPRQGSKKPWKLYQNYALDLLNLRFGRVNDGTMQFGGKPRQAARTARDRQSA